MDLFDILTPTENLSFEVVDDIVEAFGQNKLPKTSSTQYAPSEIGPLLELISEGRIDRVGPLMKSDWLDQSTQLKLRSALTRGVPIWLDHQGNQGFIRSTLDPSNPKADLDRSRFFTAMRTAAEKGGLTKRVAQSLVAALREMESNIHEHSEMPSSGILAFQAKANHFEFVVADCGIGVLATLRQAVEFSDLSDHGQAMFAALQDDVSRYGRSSGRGNGFRDLFLGLLDLNVDLRFRSGDHALIIRGPTADLKRGYLSQKAYFKGFFASLRCQIPCSAYMKSG